MIEDSSELLFLLLMLASVVILGFVIYVIWYHHSQHKMLVDELRMSRAEGSINEPPKYKKWTTDELTIAAYVALFQEPNENVINKLALHLGRTKSAVRRKLKRLQYLDTDNASTLDHQTVAELSAQGRSGAKLALTLKHNGDLSWLFQPRSQAK